MRFKPRRWQVRDKQRLREMQRREVGPNGWTCHICGDYRPDSFISVLSRISMIGMIPLQQNVRYCNDRPACLEGAKTHSFVKEEA